MPASNDGRDKEVSSVSREEVPPRVELRKRSQDNGKADTEGAKKGTGMVVKVPRNPSKEVAKSKRVCNCSWDRYIEIILVSSHG